MAEDAGQILRVHSPGNITFLCEIMSWPASGNYDVISEIRLRQSMRILFEELWSDGALGFFEEGPHQQEEKEQQQDE